MTVLIPLTRGQVTIVDDEDADLAGLKWSALARWSGDHFYGYYARRNVWVGIKTKTILIHREIMSRRIGRPLKRSEHVDHIDNDSLNNTRENLRLASASENQHNRVRNANNTTGIKGISLIGGRFRARLCVNGTRRHLGYFDTKEEAGEAERVAREKFHGEFANHGDGCVALKQEPIQPPAAEPCFEDCEDAA